MTTKVIFILTGTEPAWFFPRSGLVCLPLAPSTFSPTKQVAYSPSLKGLTKLCIDIQRCWSICKAVGSIQFHAEVTRHLKLAPLCSKNLISHIYYSVLPADFSLCLFTLPFPNQTIFRQLEGKTSLYHCLQLPLYACLELECERIL